MSRLFDLLGLCSLTLMLGACLGAGLLIGAVTAANLLGLGVSVSNLKKEDDE